MARIAGVNLPNKSLYIALTYIVGIGVPTARVICCKAGIPENKKASLLDENEVNRIRLVIEEMSAPEPVDGATQLLIEGELRKKVQSDIKNLMDMQSYRGLRHRKKLPVRGQNTRRNARTRKGKAIAIAGKKKAVK